MISKTAACRRRTSSASRQGLQDRDRDTERRAYRIGAQMIGVARGALEYAIAYTRTKQFGHADRGVSGRPVPDREAATQLEAARLMVYNARGSKMRRAFLASRHGQALLIRVAEKVTSLAVQLFAATATQGVSLENLARFERRSASTRGVNMQLARSPSRSLQADCRRLSVAPSARRLDGAARWPVSLPRSRRATPASRWRYASITALSRSLLA